jgi:flagellar hook-length control protein FliK
MDMVPQARPTGQQPAGRSASGSDKTTDFESVLEQVAGAAAPPTPSTDASTDGAILQTTSAASTEAPAGEGAADPIAAVVERMIALGPVGANLQEHSDASADGDEDQMMPLPRSSASQDQLKAGAGSAGSESAAHASPEKPHASRNGLMVEPVAPDRAARGTAPASAMTGEQTAVAPADTSAGTGSAAVRELTTAPAQAEAAPVMGEPATQRVQAPQEVPDTGINARIGTQEAPQPTASRSAPAPTAGPSVPMDVRFAEQNHQSIITAVRGNLLPNGGSMQIRLDPPELGTMQITVRVQDGTMTAAFHTSNEEATRLLSHSLQQLRHALESAGLNVERLQVQQSLRQEPSGRGGEQSGSQQHPQGQQDLHDQQRREQLQRMWQRLALGDDPLDLVA